ncbi:MAG: hypothetical protein Q9187_001506, partial [Circinaria calcarea]
LEEPGEVGERGRGRVKGRDVDVSFGGEGAPAGRGAVAAGFKGLGGGSGVGVRSEMTNVVGKRSQLPGFGGWIAGPEGGVAGFYLVARNEMVMGGRSITIVE